MKEKRPKVGARGRHCTQEVTLAFFWWLCIVTTKGRDISPPFSVLVTDSVPSYLILETKKKKTQELI